MDAGTPLFSPSPLPPRSLLFAGVRGGSDGACTNRRSCTCTTRHPMENATMEIDESARRPSLPPLLPPFPFLANSACARQFQRGVPMRMVAFARCLPSSLCPPMRFRPDTVSINGIILLSSLSLFPCTSDAEGVLKEPQRSPE